MAPTTRDVLKRLWAGEAIDSVCRDTGWSRAEFDAWWQHETASRVPRCDGEVPAPVSGAVSIERDLWGIPHIVAQRRDDLWLGFGYAMAQDRLFQMDYLRRKGLGRLAEVFGPGSLLPAGSDRARRGDLGSGRRRGPATRAGPQPARARPPDPSGRYAHTCR